MEDKLTELFDLLCDDFKKQLEEGTLSSADRKSLLEFLKENQINCVGYNNQKINSIVESLPFDENVEGLRSINQ